MTEFEQHPIGTGAELARLRAALEDIANPARLTSHGDPTVLRDRARAALKGPRDE